jgi:hypothetical protein
MRAFEYSFATDGTVRRGYAAPGYAVKQRVPRCGSARPRQSLAQPAE